MREGPQPQLLLADLPEPGEAARLDDEEEYDEAAEDDLLQVGHEIDGDDEAELRRHVLQEDRQQHDEARAQERSQDAAEAADDDHEKDVEGGVDVEGARLDA